MRRGWLPPLALTLASVWGPACAVGPGPLAALRPADACDPRPAPSWGEESGYRPVVGRFGLFPPPPLCAAPLPEAALAPPKVVPTGQAGDRARADAAKRAQEAERAQKAERGAAAGRPDDQPRQAGAPEHAHPAPAVDSRAWLAPYDPSDFSPDVLFEHAPYDPSLELAPYHAKADVDLQRPLVELGLPFYGAGPIPPSQTFLGPTNLVQQKFYVFGDYRAAFAQSALANEGNTQLAHRLNLETDYWLTSTERFHAFLGPLQRGNRFQRIEDGRFINELDFFQTDTDTAFFEGDLGQMLGGFEQTYAQFDLPFTVGLVPLLFQNGVWMQDAVVGAAATLPAKNSPLLDWSNFDVTFFVAWDRVTSGAFGADQNAGGIYGATTFVEVRGGYLEAGYGFVEDQERLGRSYHNLGISYTRRYLNRVSNSVRVIVNAGQDGGGRPQTADGVLLLVENSLISQNPYNAIPYLNFFAGFDTPQPLARGAAFGGTLFNTGILFQSDLLTSYPTLDPTGHNTYGAALGLDMIAPGFDQQLIVEIAALGTRGDSSTRSAPGDQLGLGVRWQKQLTTSHLLRADAMVGWLDGSRDIAGGRIEYRWKF